MKIQFIENIKNHIGLFFNSPVRKGRNKDFVFIHINKTGGTSVISIIGKSFRKHLTAKDIIKYIGQKKWDKIYKFTVIRNPWDRVVSQYKFRTKTNKSKMQESPLQFNEWVKKVFEENDPFYFGKRPQMYIPQVDWLKDKDNEIKIDKIIRFENLNEEFIEVADYLGIDNNLHHLNSTRKTNYHDFYDPETKAIVDKWFWEDIQIFNYEYKNY